LAPLVVPRDLTSLRQMPISFDPPGSDDTLERELRQIDIKVSTTPIRV